MHSELLRREEFFILFRVARDPHLFGYNPATKEESAMNPITLTEAILRCRQLLNANNDPGNMFEGLLDEHASEAVRVVSDWAERTHTVGMLYSRQSRAPSSALPND